MFQGHIQGSGIGSRQEPSLHRRSTILFLAADIVAIKEDEISKAFAAPAAAWQPDYHTTLM